MAVDEKGGVYMTGQSYSSNRPIALGAFPPEHGVGDYDAVAAKISIDNSDK